ncbi:hypothetical protein CQA49_06865 [Helicobacter sp. MIT 00-7814]|uniref:hypothetical protein n=1 Tax=unclassified Helicobacter TaxID=2593540 RepID=UPI000E1E6721|nr:MULTISPECIES: hypothetical protein [unclassified Helicobacter]RDU53363.1 hypothetical protein CQA49_06865 [Helicobacter sp. MIT 00-7814]RDU54184.1 hypothetical protein CQA37_06105 [Helicobacter sp. MIT 99-10781]
MLVKTPEAVKYYGLAIEIERKLKSKKIDISKKIEMKKQIEEAYKKASDEVSTILKKGEQ